MLHGLWSPGAGLLLWRDGIDATRRIRHCPIRTPAWSSRVGSGTA